VKNRLILVYGRNDYLLKKKVESFLSQAGKDWERKKLSSQEVMKGNLQFFQRSLFAWKRIFLIEAAEKINQGSWKELKKSFLSYTEDIFIFYSSKMKKSHFLIKEVKKLGKVIEVKDSSKEISQVIRREFEKRGKRISPSALSYLLQFSKDLWSVEGEVEKISLYYSQKEEISLKDVKDFISLSPTKNIFDFLNFFLSGKRKLTSEALLQVLETNSPISAFYQLSKRLQLLYEVKMLLKLGLSEKEIVEKLKLHPFHAKMLLEEEKKIGEERLEKALRECFEVEKKIKTGARHPRQALLRLVGGF
jgi:DNA polymerase III delta subunit